MEEASGETEQPPDVIARHVLWLLKYGIVRPVKPKANEHSVIGYDHQRDMSLHGTGR